MKYSLETLKEKESLLVAEIESLEKRGFYFSLFRLLTFVLTVAMYVLAGVLDSNKILFIILGTLSLAVFIVLCVFHYKSSTILKFKREMKRINSEYIARLQGDFSKLEDKGNEFIVPNHDYCIDLDIFGEQSLFSLLNISESAFGRKKFSDELLYSHTNDRTLEELIELQDAIHEFSDDLDFLEEYQTLGRIGKLKKMPMALLSFSNENEYVFKKSNKICAIILRLLWIIPVVMLFINQRFIVPSIMGIVLLNLIASFVMSSSYAKNFKAIEGISRQGGTIYKLFTKLESKKFSSKLINELLIDKNTNEKISAGLYDLSKVCGLCSLRNQPLIALVLNSLFLYDTLCAEKLCNWAVKYGKSIESNIDNLSRLESMMSASVVEIISRQSVKPTFINSTDYNENAYFKGEDMTHPLINADVVVANSIELKGETAIITGSNMSGKTTLIRTVGVITVLSYIGAYVPATSASLGRMRIMSSMRIVDSIKEEMSTFRAELVRIASIVGFAREDKPLLFLIDEIFRGTNSADRTSGAMEVLRTLNRPMVIGFMTTHDYALCDEAKEELKNISYYHFTETYKDDAIIFDYKLRLGMTKISNAKQLMKLVGIII